MSACRSCRLPGQPGSTLRPCADSQALVWLIVWWTFSASNCATWARMVLSSSIPLRGLAARWIPPLHEAAADKFLKSRKTPKPERRTQAENGGFAHAGLLPDVCRCLERAFVEIPGDVVGNAALTAGKNVARRRTSSPNSSLVSTTVFLADAPAAKKVVCNQYYIYLPI